jgi:hypothetical protein
VIAAIVFLVTDIVKSGIIFFLNMNKKLPMPILTVFKILAIFSKSSYLKS